MNNQIIRACWHTHAPLPPLFDWRNKRYIKAIDKYLDNISKAGINAIALTCHNSFNLREPRLDKKDIISVLSGNINPKTIYKIFEDRAKQKGILVFPALEIEAKVSKNTKKKVHIGVVHENEKTLYTSNPLFQTHTLEEILKVVPKGSIVDVKHPWYYKKGASNFIEFEKLKALVKKYNLLIEKHGLSTIAYLLGKRLKRIFPHLFSFGWFASQYEQLERSIKLLGFEGCKLSCGSDSHSGISLPKGGGYIELKIPNDKFYPERSRRVQISKRHILNAIQQGKGEAILPQKVGFFQGIAILARFFISLRKEEFIGLRIKLAKATLKRKIFWECIRRYSRQDKINLWLSMINEGPKVEDVLSKRDMVRIRRKRKQSRIKLNLEKLIYSLWYRKLALSFATALFFILRKIITSLAY